MDIVPAYWNGNNQFLGKFRPWKYTNQDSLNQQWQFEYVQYLGPGSRHDTTGPGVNLVSSGIYTGYTVPQGWTWPEFQIINGSYVTIDYSVYDTSAYYPAGMDSPENFLGYYGFTGTYDTGGQGNDLDGTSGFSDSTGSYIYAGNGLHHYDPHWQDYEPTQYNWGPQSHNILGAVNYLHKRGANALSFVSVNADDGDGGDTWPTGAVPDGNLPFDPHRAKLDQWDTLLQYIDSLDMVVYWKIHETENDQWSLDWFKEYTWELIARYGHYDNIVWIISEEISLNQSQIAARAQWLDDICPRCIVSLHTFPDQQDQKFPGLLPWLEALELQEGLTGIDGKLEDWVNQGKAVSWSEQNGASVGISNPTQVGAYTQAMGRNTVKGMAGFLGYRGYNWPQSDLDLETFRSVDLLQSIVTTRKVVESVDWWSMVYDDTISTDDNYVRVNHNRTTFVSFCEDGDNLVLNYNWLGTGTLEHETIWIDAITGDTLGTFTTLAGSMNPTFALYNTYNHPVWAITREKKVNPILSITSRTTFRNRVCITLDEISKVEWFIQSPLINPSDLSTSRGDYVLQHTMEGEVGEVCYDFVGCDVFDQSVYKIEATTLDGEVQELYGFIQVKPELLTSNDGVLIFPCGRTNWRLYDSTGRFLGEGYGDQFSMRDWDQLVGVYYLLLQTTGDTISIHKEE